MSAVGVLRRAGLLGAVVLVAGCASGTGSTPSGDAPSVSSSNSIPALEEGPIAAGRYVVMPPEAGWAECVSGPDCSPEPPHARSLRVEITIPDGWQAMFEGTVIAPSGDGSTEGPDGAGLVMGWTTPTAGLHSDPCLPVAHQTPDIAVGPSVADFVDAVGAHPALEVSDAKATEVGGYDGTSFTLTVPSDISGCKDWRPWEPGIAAQGPGNLWAVWVIDVDGLRMFVLTESFVGTSAADQAGMLAMVESIRFIP